MIAFSFKKFNQLTIKQLYDILSLRSEVFVVEQHCFYLDTDGKDVESFHLLGVEDDKLVAYMRLFPPTLESNDVVFGRVVTAAFVRKKGYGKKLIQEMLNYCEAHFPGVMITCSAQLYLKKFYEDFGFVAAGSVYDDAGIPHIRMQKVQSKP